MTGRPIDQLTEAAANAASVAATNDAATTALAAEVAAVLERVKNDDISNEELVSVLGSLSATANSISADSTEIANLSATVAGIEPAATPEPPANGETPEEPADPNV